MKVYLAFLPIFFLSIAFASAQEKVNEILVDKEFSSFSDATGYYNSQNSTIVINLESNSKITRSKYDSYYHLLDSYSFNSDLITFGKRKNHFFHFASEMIINGDSYEIFTSKEKLIVVKPDFNLKQEKEFTNNFSGNPP